MRIKKFLSTPDVCDILHVSRSKVYDLVREGQLRNSSTDAKRFKFSVADVEAYLTYYHSRLPYCLTDDDE